LRKTNPISFRQAGLFLKLFAFLVLFFVALTGRAQYFGFKINSGNKSIRMDYEIYNNLVIVPVIVNNVIPLHFVMDSGVRSTIITDKVYTDGLGLPHNRRIIVNGPGNFNRLQAYVVTDVSLYMTGVTGYDQSVLVLDQDYLQLSNILGTEVHGMIGYDIYNRFVMNFNFPAKTVQLIEPRKFTPPKHYDVLPLMVEDTKPYVWASVVTHDTTHIRVKLMIDTGASHSVLLKEDPSQGLRAPEKYIQAEIGRGLGGSITGKLARIKSLTLGDYTFHNVVASFPDPNNYPDSVADSERNGTLGGEILSRFNVIFDYRHGKLYLKKNHGFNRSFGYNMSGLTIIATGQKLDNFVVSFVRKGSPANKADIRPGDEVVSVNGYEGEDLDMNAIYKIFNYMPNKSVRMVIRRNGEALRKDFVLEDVI
jgi:hypothetical protein